MTQVVCCPGLFSWMIRGVDMSYGGLVTMVLGCFLIRFQRRNQADA